VGTRRSRAVPRRSWPFDRHDRFWRRQRGSELIEEVNMNANREPRAATDPNRPEPTTTDSWQGIRVLYGGHELDRALPVEDRAAGLQAAIRSHLRYTLAKFQPAATRRNYYHALVHSLRDYLIDAWIYTQERNYERDVKRVYYLSAEYMIGRHLDMVLVNLQLEEACRRALREFDLTLEEIDGLEWDAGLGAGGLGRLAACFLDSMSTLGIPSFGYGIRYEYGIFAQKIENGQQVETPDNWLRYGNPWEVPRPEYLYPVRFYGRVHHSRDAQGKFKTELHDADLVMAMAYDIPVPGYGNNVVNTLRLWAAKSSREFDLDYFSHGDYNRAVEDKTRTESISRVLYPRDDVFHGRELRLKQEYFLVSASLQDIVRRFKRNHVSFEVFPQKAAVHLNDTHPALAIPELMRILVDEEGVEWNQAWAITRETFAFTNHTLMPEALERWPVSMMEHVLPRILEIIYGINQHFLGEVVQRYPDDVERMRRMSLVEEGPEKRVRMANVAIVGSHCINGVSALHTELLCKQSFPEFYAMYPERFSNKTNGITPRLWLKKSNSALAQLISENIGLRWITHLDELTRLIPLAEDPGFRNAWRNVKQTNKKRLAAFLTATQDAAINTNSMFDCHIKRIHEYKRQLLSLLHAIVLYNRLKDGKSDAVPRTLFVSGKAAPAYVMAKTIIHLVNSVADVINRDKATAQRLALVFVPNYSVSLAEIIIPAAELSEQISTAGSEASGTSNMKMSLNGAVTIGTLDGANIEIREAVGAENFFLFGLDAAEVEAMKQRGHDPAEFYRSNGELRRAIDMIRDGYFSPNRRDLFRPVIDALLRPGEPFLVLADFAAYAACQQTVEDAYRDQDAWIRRSIMNTARIGRFSSDHTVRAYARDIWKVPVSEEMPAAAAVAVPAT
jgi:glycogen phosphorylase